MRRKVGTSALWAALSETFIQCTTGQSMRESALQGGGSDAEMAMYVARFQYAVYASLAVHELVDWIEEAV